MLLAVRFQTGGALIDACVLDQANLVSDPWIVF